MNSLTMPHYSLITFLPFKRPRCFVGHYDFYSVTTALLRLLRYYYTTTSTPILLHSYFYSVTTTLLLRYYHHHYYYYVETWRRRRRVSHTQRESFNQSVWALREARRRVPLWPRVRLPGRNEEKHRKTHLQSMTSTHSPPARRRRGKKRNKRRVKIPPNGGKGEGIPR